MLQSIVSLIIEFISFAFPLLSSVLINIFKLLDYFILNSIAFSSICFFYWHISILFSTLFNIFSSFVPINVVLNVFFSCFLF